MFARPAANWQATGREKLFTNYNAFSFPWVAIDSKTFKLHLFLRSCIMSAPTKANETSGPPLKKRIFVVMQGEGTSRSRGQMLD